jgi:hypothetical protein
MLVGGAVALLVGVVESVGRSIAMINQLQGKCDFVPCAAPADVPILAGSICVAALGVILVLAGLSLHRRIR